MSSKPPTAIRTITDVTRHGTSVNANPQYRVHFADGTSALTSSDAAIAYEIANPEYRDATVELTLTRAGRIAYARPVQPMEHAFALGYLEAAVDRFLQGEETRADLAAAYARVRAGTELYLDQTVPARG